MIPSMQTRRLLKKVHFSGTAWFLLSAAFLLVLAMRQAGAAWWLIFSLSGYSAVLLFFIISIYLFAVFRGVVRSQKIETEHPLSTATSYMILYGISPFLGAFVGFFGALDLPRFTQQASAVAVGSMITTFLVWIVFDPAIGFIEMLLPASRVHRKERLEKARIQRRQQQDENEQLLAQLFETDRKNQKEWAPFLRTNTAFLAELAAKCDASLRSCSGRIAQIGANAYKLGGIACMNLLYQMTIEACQKEPSQYAVIDQIAFCWDGIGTWHRPDLAEKLRKSA